MVYIICLPARKILWGWWEPFRVAGSLATHQNATENHDMNFPITTSGRFERKSTTAGISHTWTCTQTLADETSSGSQLHCLPTSPQLGSIHYSNYLLKEC
jgi:hypothetical protein